MRTAVNRLAQRMLPHTLRSLAVNAFGIVSSPRCRKRQLGGPRFSRTQKHAFPTLIEGTLFFLSTNRVP